MLSRWRVHFSGTVQGVGFRYTTWRLARQWRVGGCVRNLPDRRVELVVEGDERELQGFVDEICGAMDGHIEQVIIEKSQGTGEFTGFQIGS